MRQTYHRRHVYLSGANVAYLSDQSDKEGICMSEILRNMLSDAERKRDKVFRRRKPKIKQSNEVN